MSTPPVYSTLAAYGYNVAAGVTRYVPPDTTFIIRNITVFQTLYFPLDSFIVYSTLTSARWACLDAGAGQPFVSQQCFIVVGQLDGIAGGSLLGEMQCSYYVSGQLLQGNMPGPFPV